MWTENIENDTKTKVWTENILSVFGTKTQFSNLSGLVWTGHRSFVDVTGAGFRQAVNRAALGTRMRVRIVRLLPGSRVSLVSNSFLKKGWASVGEVHGIKQRVD